MRIQKKVMRKPNTQMYGEGELWFYYNNHVSKNDYIDTDKNDDVLSSRPVLILSNSTGATNTNVVVCEITHSPSQPGYIVDIGPGNSSVILPYKIHTIRTCYLAYRMCVLTPDAFADVKKAVAYHMGLSNEIPPYYEFNEICDENEEETNSAKEIIENNEIEEAIKVYDALIRNMPACTDLSKIDTNARYVNYKEIVDCLSLEELLTFNPGTKKTFMQKRFCLSYYKINALLMTILDRQRQIRSLLKMKIAGGKATEEEIQIYNKISMYISDSAVL